MGKIIATNIGFGETNINKHIMTTSELLINIHLHSMKKPATLQNIIKAVEDISGVSEDEIKGNDRHGDIIPARHICYYFARKSGYTLKDIGKYFNRDHSTVIKGIKSAEDRLHTQNEDYLNILNILKTKII